MWKKKRWDQTIVSLGGGLTCRPSRLGGVCPGPDMLGRRVPRLADKNTLFWAAGYPFERVPRLRGAWAGARRPRKLWALLGRTR